MGALFWVSLAFAASQVAAVGLTVLLATAVSTLWTMCGIDSHPDMTARATPPARTLTIGAR